MTTTGNRYLPAVWLDVPADEAALARAIVPPGFADMNDWLFGFATERLQRDAEKGGYRLVHVYRHLEPNTGPAGTLSVFRVASRVEGARSS